MRRKWFILLILLAFNFLFIYGINYANQIMFANNFMIYLHEENKPLKADDSNEKELDIDTNYNGESVEQITKRLEQVFQKTELEGHGNYIASSSLKKGVNPYLIGGIILESTKCKIDCSVVFRECRNVSGMKGAPGCFGGSYKEYNDIDESIKDLVNKISNDFYSTDMQVPNKMYKEYGKNLIWAFKVNKYMEDFKKGK